MQKLDQNKILTESNFIQSNDQFIMPLRGCQLNFYLPQINRSKKTLFTLKLIEKQNLQQYQIGQIEIDSSEFIDQFKQKGNVRFQKKIDISELYALEYEIYIEKSRFGLEKLVKNYRNERYMKSPTREIRSPVQERRIQYNDLEAQIFNKKSPKVQMNSEKTQSIIKRTNNNNNQSSKIKISAPIQDQEAPKTQKNQKSVKKQRFNRTQSNQPQVQQAKKQILKDKSLKKQSNKSPIIQRSQKKINEQKSPIIVVNKEIQKNKQPIQKHSSSTLKKSSNTITQSSLNANSKKQISTKSIPNSIQKQSSKPHQNWQDNIKLIIFTIIGAVLIFWVMHPNKKA